MVVALAAVGMAAGSAQADTTIPGLNGRIAYTTNAAVFPFVIDAPATRQVKCATFPLPIASELLSEFTDSFLFPFNTLNCEAEIATVNPDGSDSRLVTNDTTDPVQDDAPAWLPQDGSKIAYQSLRNEEGCEPFLKPRGTLLDACLWNIWSAAPDGSGNTQLTGLTDDVFQAQHPSFSPDGSRIAFEALNPGFLESAATRDFGVSAGFEDLSHAGQVIFTMPAGGTTAGTPTQVEPSSEVGPVGQDSFVSDFQPTFSPDGSKIAFTRLTVTNVTPTAASKGGQFQQFTFTSSIYVAPATGGPATAVESTPSCTVSLPLEDMPASRAATPRGEEACVWDSTPAWSPDGSKLAATRTTFPADLFDAPAQRGVFVVGEDADIIAFNSADGGGLVDLSKVVEPSDCDPFPSKGGVGTCAMDEKPAWSPDGTKIAFFSNRDSTGLFPFTQCKEDENQSVCDDEIWTMNVDGTSPFQVTNNDVNDINPDWQRIPPPPAPPAAQPPATPAAVPPKVGVAGVRRACVSSAFHVRFRIATTSSSVKSVVVKLDGKRIKSTSRGSFTLTINAKKLKSGRHRLTITATDSNGHVTTTRKSFSVCKAAKPRRRAAPRFTG